MHLKSPEATNSKTLQAGSLRSTGPRFSFLNKIAKETPPCVRKKEADILERIGETMLSPG